MCTELPTCNCCFCKPSDRHDPTPQQIAAECERIRMYWGATERLSRIADDASRRIASSRQPCMVVDDSQVSDSE